MKTLNLVAEGNQIDFKSPWKRISYVDAIKDKTGIDVINATEKELKELAKNIGIDTIRSRRKSKTD